MRASIYVVTRTGNVIYRTSDRAIVGVYMYLSMSGTGQSKRLDPCFQGAERLLLRLQHGLLSGIFHWHKSFSLTHSSVGGAEPRATHFQRWRQRIHPKGFHNR